ncbi:MAG: class I SAM-dependent methyltransferase [Bacteroidetes bacterium]|nr:class I SAM-dependent methyltransferase [Bacteroidota bacterium]
MSEFWDSRFATHEYIYGKKPNAFLKQQLDREQPGKILFAAEGEGRNAVYAAHMGFDVFAFDASEVAKLKAIKLADELNVMLHYKTASFKEVVYPENKFDYLVLIFAHMHPDYRTVWHRKLLRYLRPGGKLILEGFSKKQIHYQSGGPRDVAMLFSEEELLKDFEFMRDKKITHEIYQLNEGAYHQGKAAVIRLTGTK